MGGLARCAVAMAVALPLVTLLHADEEPAPVVVRDSTTPREHRRIHDVERVEFRASRGRMHVTLEFVEEVRKGVFTRAELRINCDQKGRDDLIIRASVGSRYRPLAGRDSASGGPPALELLQASFREWAVIEDRSTGEQRESLRGNTHPGISKPSIKGRLFSFSFPLTMLRDHGLRYNRAIDVVVRAESSIAEELVSLDYVCGDEGFALTIDGDPEDWPEKGPRATDVGGDLHPSTREVDLREIRVEHGRDRIYALVRLAESGFGRTVQDTDVWDFDTVSLGIEPLGAAYMPYVEVEASTRKFRRRFSGERNAYGYTTGDALVEFAIARRQEQTRFRVIAWTDAIRVDRIPDTGSIELSVPPAAWSKD